MYCLHSTGREAVPRDDCPDIEREENAGASVRYDGKEISDADNACVVVDPSVGP